MMHGDDDAIGMVHDAERMTQQKTRRIVRDDDVARRRCIMHDA